MTLLTSAPLSLLSIFKSLQYAFPTLRLGDGDIGLEKHDPYLCSIMNSYHERWADEYEKLMEKECQLFGTSIPEKLPWVTMTGSDYWSLKKIKKHTQIQ